LLNEIDNITALENLIKDSNLHKLESQFGGFNIFESIGAVRRELRHSDFLAFLLNPSENHQLFDRFIKPFLFRVAERTDTVSVIDVDLLNYDDIQIRREWKNIDIMIVSEQSKFVCAIENKIDAGESEKQLETYFKAVNKHFPNYKKVFVFLTKEGIDASDANADTWISFSYSEVFETLKQLLKEHKDTLGQDIHFAISQYKEIVERHIMTDTTITKLCQAIYKEHKQALDMIFENRPDVQLEMKDFLNEKMESFVNSSSLGISKDDCNKTYTRFSIDSWSQKKYPFLRCNEEKWTSSHNVLLFEIVNKTNRIVVDFVIGPANRGHEKLREHVFKAIKGESILNSNIKKLSKKFSHATQFVLTDKKIDFDNLEEAKEEVFENLKIFFNSEENMMFRNIVKTVASAIESYQIEINE